MFTDEVAGAEDLGVWDWDATKYGFVTHYRQVTGDTTMTEARRDFYAIASYPEWREQQNKKAKGAY